jgi:isoquinoline 1-oxidoreductase subunit alpha
MIELTINGRTHRLDIEADTPLLWAIRDTLGMTGTKYGCGIVQCGACTAHVDGQATRSCVTPVDAFAGAQVTTIEAIGEDPVGRREGLRRGLVTLCIGGGQGIALALEAA